MQDEQFDYIDRGWAAMKETLDREMPVGRRRRAIWWWWPVGIGALLLLGWAVWSITPMAKTSAPDPVAQSEEPTTTSKAFETTGVTNRPAEGATGGDEQTPEPSLPTIATTPSAATAFTKKNRPTWDLLPSLPGRTTLVSSRAPKPQLFTDIEPTLPRNVLAPFDPLVASSTLLIAKQPDVPAPVLRFVPRTHWEIWVEAGSHHGGTNWLSGGQVGVLLRKPLGKWQFQTGVSLGMRQLAYERGTEFVSLSQNEQDSPVNPDVGLGNPNNVEAPLPADLSLLVTQLRTQASLQRTFGDHWRAGVGIGASYWVDARRQWTYVPGATFEPTQESRDFVNQFSGSNGQRVTETTFRSFGLSALAGIEYQFNPRWAAGLDYHFGLTNHSLVDGFVMYDRYGQVSIRYRIK